MTPVLARQAPVAPRAQAGVALAIVLWFIAGMSLLVAGIVSQARVDTHMAQLHVARAKVVAAGDGAIRLRLAELLTARGSPAGEGSDAGGGYYRLGEDEVRVTLVPVAGLIDINSAAPEVLLGLFLQAGVEQDEAQALAENVLQSRSPAAAPGAPGGSGRLEAMEDLLRVPGMSRSLLDAVRDFIVVGTPAQGGMNWSVAPDEVLAVLDRVDETRAAGVRARQGATAGNGAPVLARAYRADAVLRYGGRNWLRRQWIEMSAASGGELPWSVVRTEPPRVLRDNNDMTDRAADAG
ncbi:MAG: general secretion pathway protein GspK [Halieaceae bacterium]|nr:general secretion pathway protein GspK [Halieaceae bacterium]MCP5147991.1 general secretion pathway protein GspK [Pseudomonadales bacterium]MCP5167121.1 general secretion pathway protein GspK [Pseudomonadales bacterium]MCP5188437.1 general secretion pathway protein GspK [Pseudomonadales bacterium]